MLYAGTKLLHVMAVILWIGPPLGAYYILVQAYREGEAEKILWAERCCERVLLAEHVALLFLVLSGVLLTYMGNWSYLYAGWFQKKMLCFVGILLFEAFDIWLAHVIFARLLREVDPLQEPGWKLAIRKRNYLLLASLPVGLLLIPAVLYYALMKA